MRLPGGAPAAWWVAIVIACALVVSASAQVMPPPRIIHLDQFTCAEFGSVSPEGRDRILIYLDGYVAGMRRQIIWDERAEGELIDRAASFCKADPSQTLLSAFQRATKGERSHAD